MNNEIKYATKRLLDSVWTLAYKEVGADIEIVSYDRENSIGYAQENYLPTVRLVEGEGRVVQGAEILPVKSLKTRYFLVANPQFVFSYKGDK